MYVECGHAENLQQQSMLYIIPMVPKTCVVKNHLFKSYDCSNIGRLMYSITSFPDMQDSVVVSGTVQGTAT
jgi:hypothetical protein